MARYEYTSSCTDRLRHGRDLVAALRMWFNEVKEMELDDLDLNSVERDEIRHAIEVTESHINGGLDRSRSRDRRYEAGE